MSGFTSWPLPGDAKRVYVSATGNDSNDGLTDSTPKLTLSAGRALLTTGKGDHLCLKCGDTWTNQTFGTWGATSGKNASEPIVILSYGTGARPIVQWDGNPGAGVDKVLLMLGNTAVISHIAVAQIHFRAINYGGDSATNGGIVPLYYLSTGSNLHIEDCVFEGCNNNLLVQGYPASPGLDGLTVRRNILKNPFLTNTGGTSFYLDGCSTILIEENVLYQTDANETAGNKLSHNLYMSETGSAGDGIVVRDNIVYNARSNLTIRLSSRVENNLCIKAAANGIGIGYDDSPQPAPIECQVGWNVVTESRPHWNGQQIGWGVVLRNCDRTFVYRNIVMRSTEVMENHFAFNLGASCQYAVIRDNFAYDWKDAGSTNAISALVYLNQVTGPVLFLNNTFDQPVENWILSAETAGPTALNECTFTGNRYNAARSSCFYNVGAANDTIAEWIANIDTTGTSGAPAYPDISRTVGKYYVSIGGTDSTEAFVVAAATRDLGEWDERYTAAAANAWIRAGFYTMSYTQDVCDAIWSAGTRALLVGSPHAAGDYTQSIVNEVWDETTRELTIPDPPTAVVIISAEATSAYIAWTLSATSGVTRYIVRYGLTAGNLNLEDDSDDVGTDITIQTDIDYGTWNPNGLTMGATYYFEIVAVNPSGVESNPTTEDDFTLRTVVPVTGDRIYLTSGTFVAGANVDWVNAGNVNGADNGDYANTSLSSNRSDILGGTTAATTPDGTVIAWKLGITLASAAAPHASANVLLQVSSGGVVVGDAVSTAVPTTTKTEYEYYLDTTGAGGLAAFNALVAAGMTGETLGAPNGPNVTARSLSGATDFRVYAVWLQPILAGAATGGGFSSNQNVAATCLLLPSRRR